LIYKIYNIEKYREIERVDIYKYIYNNK